MFDPIIIEDIARQSKAERWPFPKTFTALKEAGVLYYDVETANHAITYFGDDKQLLDPVPSDFKPLQVREKFDAASVKRAIDKHRVEKTHYEDFLKEITEAGVRFYRVDMIKRTVTYYGGKTGEEYAEKVPQF